MKNNLTNEYTAEQLITIIKQLYRFRHIETYLKADIFIDIVNILLLLPPEERKILFIKYYYCKTPAEIAKDLNRSVDYVVKHTRKAFNLIREICGESE